MTHEVRFFWWHITWLAYERWQLRRWMRRVERRRVDLGMDQ